MSKLHDELIGEIGPWENVEDNMTSLLGSIADRIDACNGNRVKLSDLSTILREDPQAVSAAVQKLAPIKQDVKAPAPIVQKETPELTD